MLKFLDELFFGKQPEVGVSKPTIKEIDKVFAKLTDFKKREFTGYVKSGLITVTDDSIIFDNEFIIDYVFVSVDGSYDLQEAYLRKIIAKEFNLRILFSYGG